eukprot:351685_1
MKRKFVEIDHQKNDEKTDEIIPSKKQKINNEIRSFDNENDQKLFIKIFKSLQELESLKKMNIPNDIFIEIAEFSTGHWIKHTDCGAEISVLHEDEGFAVLCPECEQYCRLDACEICHKSEMLTETASNDNLWICRICERYQCRDCHGTDKCGGYCNLPMCRECLAKASMCSICGKKYCGDINCQRDLTAKCGCCGNQYCVMPACCRECRSEGQSCGCRGDEACMVIGNAGYCVMCGKQLCEKCVKFTGNENSTQCICAKCIIKHKDIFKHLS